VGEVCDDGNTRSGDGCNAACTVRESCGNGRRAVRAPRAATIAADAGGLVNIEAGAGSVQVFVAVTP
jgi:hypothetical protein